MHYGCVSRWWMCFLFSLSCVFVLGRKCEVRPRPAVIMHGNGADNSTMIPLVQWIKDAIPGIYVRNAEVGDGKHDSWFMTMDKEVEYFCREVQNDPLLKDGFNLLGYSQGSLVTRGFIQRCGSPQVHNYITVGGVHGGYFGIPDLPEGTLERYLYETVSIAAYTDTVQDHISVSGFWRDPFHLDEYIKKCRFLPDLNCETGQVNETYRENMKKLNSFVMVISSGDTMIKPLESGWFSTFSVDSDTDIIPLREQQHYKDDCLGLRTLDEDGRIHFLKATCRHQDYPDEPDEKFFKENLLSYFNNTITVCT